MPLDFSIRPFDNRDKDFAALVALRVAYTPEHPETIAALREADARREAKIKAARFVAEMPSGEVAGIAAYEQSARRYDPHKFYGWFVVAPAKQNQGIGGALYAHLLENLAPFIPHKISCRVRENSTQSIAFVRKRGFVEERRKWEAKLRVADFDDASWQSAYVKPHENGIVIRSFAELSADAGRDRKIWEAEMEMSGDIPSPDLFTPLSFDAYQKQVLSEPNTLAAGFFVAIDEATGAYVGISTLRSRPTDRDLNTGLTAVKRTYRRKGIALALKLRAIEFAKSYGAGFVRTENASTNEGMLAINNALGFVRQPAWISFGKYL